MIDNREQNADYIKLKFDSIGIESEIVCLPYKSGADYYVANTHGSCAIQRKSAMKELVTQMEDLRYDILPRLISYTDNPVLLVEEDFQVGDAGYLFRKEGSMYIETQMHSSSYYGFLETVRMMGVDVVAVRATTDLMPTIWYLAAMDGYLSKFHYPRHIKTFKPNQQAVGMLCCVNGIGMKRAQKALDGNSIKDVIGMQKVNGLTDTQLKKVKKVLTWRG